MRILYAFAMNSNVVRQDEFEMNMRLLGARTIDEVVPDMVDASSLKSHFVMTPQDNLFTNTCKFCPFECVSVPGSTLTVRQTSLSLSPSSGMRSCNSSLSCSYGSWVACPSLSVPSVPSITVPRPIQYTSYPLIHRAYNEYTTKECR